MIIVDRAGRAFELGLGSNLVGRGLQCNLRLDSPLISRSHAQISWDGRTATVTDLHSTNGVLLNGRRLEPGLAYPLEPGDVVQFGDPAARLQVQARDLQGLPAVPAVPKPRVAEQAGPRPAPVAEPLPFECSLAVVVGIDDYGDGIARLTTAVNDASDLADLLERRHGYETIRLTQDVTRDRLVALLQETLPHRLGDNDRLLFYFAGHGVALDGDQGPAGHLIPQDAHPGDRSTYLAMDDLHRWLSNLRCRHLLAILDCCFAGAFQWVATRDLGLLLEVLHKERYDRFVRSPAWQVLTSAAFDQTALDVLAGDSKRGALSDRDGAHSPFAQALFEALEGAADIVPRGTGNGVITATELYVYLRDRVEPLVDEQAQHEQTPGLWPLKKHRKGEYIFLTGQPRLPPAPELSPANNPYRGLQPYDEQHSSLFFGREDEINGLIHCVTESPLTIVVGASGTGKSSLVQAGLLPALGGSVPAQGAAIQSSLDAGSSGGWFVLPPLRPSATPLHELAQRLAPYLASWGTALDTGRWHRDPHALSGALAAWRHTYPGRRMLLVVDQLEELITLCRDDDERDHFLKLLAEAVRQHPDVLCLVVTLRTDFEPQFAESSLFAVHSSRFARYVVPPMDQDDLRQVIEGPATERVLYFEPPELVDSLINEVVQMPGALPLLSFTLSEMYLRYVRTGRDDRSLRQEDYDALGGVIGSLRQRATEEYNALPDDAHRATMQRVMLRMISTEGGELARRRVMWGELVYPTAEENHRVQTVLNRLVTARLLVRGRSGPSTRAPLPGATDSQEGAPVGKAGAEPYVEPAHDALVLAWDRLLQWKRDAEEYLPLQRRTAQAALEWVSAPEGERAGLLWNDDPRLPQLERALAPAEGQRRGPLGRVRRALWPDATAPRDTAWLNWRELAFTQASVRRRAAIFKRIVGITAAVILALAGLAAVAWVQAGVARDNAATAVAEADRRATEVVVRTTAQASEAEARQVAQTREADAQTAATAEAEAHALAELRRAEAEAEARRSRAGELAALAISAPEWIPEQSLLLAVEALSTTLRTNEPAVPSARQALRDVLGRPSGLPVGSGDGVYSNVAAFSPDGQWLATAGGYGYVGMNYNPQLWSMSDPMATAVVLRGQTSGIQTMAFSPDGRWLAADGGGNVRLWETSDLQAEPIVLDGGPPNVAAFQFSPDGRWLAALSSSYAVSLWDVTGKQVDLQATRDPAGATGDQDVWLDAAALAFSHDSKWLATAGPEDTARLWKVDDGLTGAGVLRGHEDDVKAVAFSADGRWLASGSADHTVRLWDVSDPQATPRVLRGHEWVVSVVTFSPDGTLLLTGGEDHFALLWDLTRPQAEPMVLRNDKYWIYSLAFSPDGRWIVTGSQWKAHLWDASDPLATPKVLWGNYGPVRTTVFSPGGRWLATAGPQSTGIVDEAVRLWDMADLQPDPIILAGHDNWVRAVAVSANGEWAATAPWTDGSPVRLWDLTDPPGELELANTYTGTVRSLAFSPDDSRLAAVCADGFVRLWNPADLGAAPVLIASGGALGFSPDGHWLVTGSESGTVQLWNLVDTDAEPLLLQGHSDRVTAAAFSLDGRRLATSSADGTVRTYDVSDLQAEPLVLQGIESPITAVAFSPDGRWLATGHGGKVLGGFDSYPALLWDLSDPSLQPAVLPGHKDNVRYVAFSPDGRWLATAPETDFDTEVRLWDVADPEASPLLLKGHEELITDMAFSPDGLWLATSSADDTARLWDMAHPETAPLVLRGHEDIVAVLAFSRDSRWLITGSYDTTARVWRLRQDEQMKLACLFAGRNFALDEWQRYFPGEPYHETCPDRPAHPSVVATTQEQ